MVPLMGKRKEKHFLPTLLTRMGKEKKWTSSVSLVAIQYALPAV